MVVDGRRFYSLPFLLMNDYAIARAHAAHCKYARFRFTVTRCEFRFRMRSRRFCRRFLFVILGICACMHFSFRYGSRWSLVAQWMLSIFTTALCQWITHSAQTTKKVNSSCAKKSVLMEFCALHRLPKMSFRFDAVIAIYVLRQTSKWPFTIFRFWPFASSRVDWNQECRRRIVTSTQCTYLRPGLIALPTIQSHSSCSCRWSTDNWRILRRIIIDTYSYVKGTKCTLIAANEIKREKNAANRLIESLIPSLVHIYFITYYRCAEKAVEKKNAASHHGWNAVHNCTQWQTVP